MSFLPGHPLADRALCQPRGLRRYLTQARNMRLERGRDQMRSARLKKPAKQSERAVIFLDAAEQHLGSALPCEAEGGDG